MRGLEYCGSVNNRDGRILPAFGFVKSNQKENVRKCIAREEQREVAAMVGERESPVGKERERESQYGTLDYPKSKSTGLFILIHAIITYLY